VKVTLYGLSFLSADKAKYTIKVTNPSTKPKPTSSPSPFKLKSLWKCTACSKAWNPQAHFMYSETSFFFSIIYNNTICVHSEKQEWYFQNGYF
jgi:hypothetical protein